MLNKLLKIFTREPQFIVKPVAIVILVFLTAFLSKKIQTQTIEVIRLSQKRAVAAQVPTLERDLKFAQERKKKLEASAAVQESKFTLSGIFVQKDSSTPSTAIINGEVYSQGDTIGNYVISEINSNVVTLQEKTTGQKIFLMM